MSERLSRSKFAINRSLEYVSNFPIAVSSLAHLHGKDTLEFLQTSKDRLFSSSFCNTTKSFTSIESKSAFNFARSAPCIRLAYTALTQENRYRYQPHTHQKNKGEKPKWLTNLLVTLGSSYPTKLTPRYLHTSTLPLVCSALLVGVSLHRQHEPETNAIHMTTQFNQWNGPISKTCIRRCRI